MEISNRFNRYYHGAILKDLFNKSNDILFRSLKDTRTNRAFKIVKHQDYNDVDDLKQLLKILNVNYGVDTLKDKKISTKDISVKELLNHVEWVFELAAQNSIELNVVREEWERLVNQYNR